MYALFLFKYYYYNLIVLFLKKEKFFEINLPNQNSTKIDYKNIKSTFFESTSIDRFFKCLIGSNDTRCKSVVQEGLVYHLRNHHKAEFNSIDSTSIPAITYNDRLPVKINFETQFQQEHNQVIIKCNHCIYQCQSQKVIDINTHAKMHIADYELHLKENNREYILYYTFKNGNILLYICVHCNYCTQSEKTDMLLQHSCLEGKIVRINLLKN